MTREVIRGIFDERIPLLLRRVLFLNPHFRVEVERNQQIGTRLLHW